MEGLEGVGRLGGHVLNLARDRTGQGRAGERAEGGGKRRLRESRVLHRYTYTMNGIW